jgi:cupin 2 domain-containing protein
MEMKTGNLFAEIPDEKLAEESFEPLWQRGGLKVERIVSEGHATPPESWYDQRWDEWVLVLRGGARLLCEGEPPIDLGPGDYVLIPARTRHRVERTDAHQKTIWLAIHARD